MAYEWDDEMRAAHSARVKASWTPERRAANALRMREVMKAKWADPTFRAGILPKLIESNKGSGGTVFKGGTPIGNGLRQLTIQLDEDQVEELKTKAKHKRVKVVELIRTYIEWGLENDE